ncbi:piercer of microtubule wall 1 protein-like [Apostichopus japonicus]|uniref:piercer of microtubule wall 1 protein-like n=1 Tax=Stichopus japonicus TaxID=307972 RepID=UPI003AB12F92
MASSQPEMQNVPLNESAAPNEKGERTSDYYKTQTIPDRFEHPESFQGYNNKAQHIMYITTNMKYGSKAPTVHTVPTSFHCKSQKFTEHLGKCGMYRNEGLNTALDQSKV